MEGDAALRVDDAGFSTALMSTGTSAPTACVGRRVGTRVELEDDPADRA